MSLLALNQQHKSAKDVAGLEAHHTLEPHKYIAKYYQEKFLGLKEQTKKLIEIGVYHGASIKLWHDYFLNATIYGIDKNSRMKNFFSTDEKYKDRCKIITGDSTNIDTYKEIPNDIDIVIDDGSHRLFDQIKTFDLLFPKIKIGGLYIIEDVLALDEVKQKLLDLHRSVKIYDFRDITNRHDSVLVEIIK